MRHALPMLRYAEPYWLHDGAVAVAGVLWLYWGWRRWRRWPRWQLRAYVAGAALLARYETLAGMTWYWGASGFVLLAWHWERLWFATVSRLHLAGKVTYPIRATASESGNTRPRTGAARSSSLWSSVTKGQPNWSASVAYNASYVEIPSFSPSWRA